MYGQNYDLANRLGLRVGPRRGDGEQRDALPRARPTDRRQGFCCTAVSVTARHDGAAGADADPNGVGESEVGQVARPIG